MVCLYSFETRDRFMTMTQKPTKALELFYSYAHTDERWRRRLEIHLSNLQRRGLITGWHDRNISAGTAWASEIDKHLNTAHIILLLISPDFIASDYCYSIEMKRAMERHKAGEARIIPVILRPTDWEGTPFKQLQALPTNAKPLTRWQDIDEALLDVANGIRKVVEELSTNLFPTHPSFVCNIPYRRNPSFTGRENLLKHLHETLTTTKATALTQPQAITGLGGIGKTQTAVEYAYRYCDEYRFVLWVSAATRDTLISDFVTLADLLHLPEKEEQNQNIVVAAIKRWLESHKAWLFILDNADDLVMTY